MEILLRKNITISKITLLRQIDMNHLIVFSKNEEVIYFLLFIVIILNLVNIIFGKVDNKRNGFTKIIFMVILFNLGV